MKSIKRAALATWCMASGILIRRKLTLAISSHELTSLRVTIRKWHLVTHHDGYLNAMSRRVVLIDLHNAVAMWRKYCAANILHVVGLQRAHMKSNEFILMKIRQRGCTLVRMWRHVSFRQGQLRTCMSRVIATRRHHILECALHQLRAFAGLGRQLAARVNEAVTHYNQHIKQNAIGQWCAEVAFLKRTEYVFQVQNEFHSKNAMSKWLQYTAYGVGAYANILQVM